MEPLSEAKAEAVMHLKRYLIGRRILKAKRSLEIQETRETRKMHLETEDAHHEKQRLDTVGQERRVRGRRGGACLQSRPPSGSKPTPLCMFEQTQQSDCPGLNI